MKKLISIVIIIVINLTVFGQQIGYVDSEYILNKMPEYKSAIEQINQLSIKWNKEIKDIYDEVENMYKDYQTKQFMIPKEDRIIKEQEILNKEKEAKNLEQQRYGTDGDLFKKRNELIQPIQDRILNAINDFSEQYRYDIIFNKNSDLIMLYTNDRFNKSDEILKILGY